MIEIGRVRVRLEAIRNKVECYPPYPPEPQPAREPEVWTPRMWDRLQQLEARVLYTEKKSMEKRADRATNKFTID